jgi:tyrosine-protein phosphatase SIW14
MKMKRRVISRRIQQTALATSIAFSLILPAFAGAGRNTEKTRGKATVNIKNFGKINDNIYRGGQPRDENYRELVAFGIKTIVDLREDHERDAKSEAEKAGLRYINLPMAPKSYPSSDAADRFLEIVNNEANWPVYVHCAGGRHRTGAMFAVYRMKVDAWDIEKTYQEMKDYDFYTRMGHGCYKDYVYDYHRSLQSRAQSQPVGNTKAVVNTGQSQ